MTSVILPLLDLSITVSIPISESVPPRPITVLDLALTGSKIYLTGAYPSLVITIAVPYSPSFLVII
jgi:hypothetical protein